MIAPERPESGFVPASNWSPRRIVIALFGALVMAVSASGVYLSQRRADEARTASGSAFAFRVHDAPRALPEFSFQDGTGRTRSLVDFRGKWLLLNVWATWCGPCREEMPALERLQQALAGPGFAVVALSIDVEGVAAVQHFYEETGIRTLPIYVDSSMRSSGPLGAVGLPTTLLIDREGREIGRRLGAAKWDAPESVRMIERYTGAIAR